MTDKIRLALIASIRFPNIDQSKILPYLDEELFNDGLSGLNAFEAFDFQSNDPRDAKWRYSYRGWKQATQKASSFFSIGFNNTNQDMFQAHRYVPVLSYLIHDIIRKKFEDCPWLVPVSPNDSPDNHSSLANVGRGEGSIIPFNGNFKPTWGASKPSDENADSVDYLRNGPRIIVFVVGGLSHTEMRVAYDSSIIHKRDVIIGSTNVAPPLQFLDELCELGYESAQVEKISIPSCLQKIKPAELQQPKGMISSVISSTLNNSMLSKTGMMKLTTDGLPRSSSPVMQSAPQFRLSSTPTSAAQSQGGISYGSPQSFAPHEKVLQTKRSNPEKMLNNEERSQIQRPSSGMSSKSANSPKMREHSLMSRKLSQKRSQPTFNKSPQLEAREIHLARSEITTTSLPSNEQYNFASKSTPPKQKILQTQAPKYRIVASKSIDKPASSRNQDGTRIHSKSSAESLTKKSLSNDDPNENEMYSPKPKRATIHGAFNMLKKSFESLRGVDQDVPGKLKTKTSISSIMSNASAKEKITKAHKDNMADPRSDKRTSASYSVQMRSQIGAQETNNSNTSGFNQPARQNRRPPPDMLIADIRSVSQSGRTSAPITVDQTEPPKRSKARPLSSPLYDVYVEIGVLSPPEKVKSTNLSYQPPGEKARGNPAQNSAHLNSPAGRSSSPKPPSAKEWSPTSVLISSVNVQNISGLNKELPKNPHPVPKVVSQAGNVTTTTSSSAMKSTKNVVQNRPLSQDSRYPINQSTSKSLQRANTDEGPKKATPQYRQAPLPKPKQSSSSSKSLDTKKANSNYQQMPRPKSGK